MTTDLFTTTMTFRGLSDEDEDEQTIADREDLDSEDLDEDEDDEDVAEETEVAAPEAGESESE